MGYKVIVSPRAKLYLKNIVQYVKYVLKNPTAAERIFQDAEKTMNKLTYLAESLKVCEEPELAEQGYRVILFQKHDYMILYRVDGEFVFVDGVFHRLQDYYSWFK